MDESTRRIAERLGIGAQELMRRYSQPVTDWSEPGVVNVYRSGKLLGTRIVSDQVKLWKRMFRLPGDRALG